MIRTLAGSSSESRERAVLALSLKARHNTPNFAARLMFALRRMVKAFRLSDGRLAAEALSVNASMSFVTLLYRLRNHGAVALPVYVGGAKCLLNSEKA